MKIRVLLYRARFDGHLLDDFISLWTGIFNWGTGPYSHAEIWIPSISGSFNVGCGFSSGGCPVYEGTCYTSTMRDDVNGVVKRPAAQVLKHPERWDYIEIEVDKTIYDMAVTWMNKTVDSNPGYDIKCILSFFWFRRWHRSRKFICSEFCERVLWRLYIFDRIRCPSPRRLSRWLVQKGYKINHLAGD